MGSMNGNHQACGGRRKPSQVKGSQLSRVNSTPSLASSKSDHAEERKQLQEVYDTMFNFMRRNVELERQRTDLERQCAYLQSELQAVLRREEDAKVSQLEGRRAERRYQQILVGLTDIAYEYRVSLDQISDFESLFLEEAATDPAASERRVYRLRRLIHAPLERIEEVFKSQGITSLQATPEVAIDLRLFDVAGVRDDSAFEPGTVVSTHRPAYVSQDGAVIRKGAAIVTRRGAAVFE